MFHVCDCLNFLPNARSSPLAPDEMVEGHKINFRTDILASFGTLVLVSNKSSGHVKPLVRRPLKTMPMTDDWLSHLDDLASKSPTDPATMLEFRPGFEATPFSMPVLRFLCQPHPPAQFRSVLALLLPAPPLQRLTTLPLGRLPLLLLAGSLSVLLLSLPPVLLRLL
mmetsp:Transcript_17650/g.24225  ORF Transcript_17650/g.24225 Transcript_17650/m.24225 type:complete len:167 (-) Transcript_17650:361-861(-)